MLNRVLKNQKGFSLLEMLAAVTVFSIVALAATDIFQMAVEGQRSAIASQNTQESMRYALEVMSKELRMAQKTLETDEDCPVTIPIEAGKIFKTDFTNVELYFRNIRGECVKYFLDADRLRIWRESVQTGNRYQKIYYITPDEIKISNLKFSIYDISNEYHSKVTMSMDVEAVGKELHKQPFKIQMTVSSRYYE